MRIVKQERKNSSGSGSDQGSIIGITQHVIALFRRRGAIIVFMDLQDG